MRVTPLTPMPFESISLGKVNKVDISSSYADVNFSGNCAANMRFDHVVTVTFAA